MMMLLSFASSYSSLSSSRLSSIADGSAISLGLFWLLRGSAFSCPGVIVAWLIIFPCWPSSSTTLIGSVVFFCCVEYVCPVCCWSAAIGDAVGCCMVVGGA